MKWISLVTAILGFLSGCTGKNELLPSAPDTNAAVLAEIQRDLSDLERNSAGEMTALKSALDQVSKEAKSTAEDLQQQILLKDQRIAGLETRIQQLQNEIRKLKDAQGKLKFDLSTKPPLADPFPVRILDVKGRKVVTGDHTTAREVETDKTYKNVFGNKVKQTRLEDVQVHEYGYQADFSVENPTQAPIEIAVSAGSETAIFVVPPGRILHHLTVNSAMGADLAVMVGGYTRRFPILYESLHPREKDEARD